MISVFLAVLDNAVLFVVACLLILGLFLSAIGLIYAVMSLYD